MNCYIEYNIEEYLLGYNSDEIYLQGAGNDFVEINKCAKKPKIDAANRVVNTNEPVNRKKWTDKEKEIIINNIPSYRKELCDSDKPLAKKITKDFASNLLSKYNSIYEHRSVEAIANRLAYFDELLAGVQTHFAKIDKIYFGKLKRLDGDTTENPVRKW